MIHDLCNVFRKEVYSILGSVYFQFRLRLYVVFQQFKKDVGLIARPKQHKIWQSRVPINNKLFECPAARKQHSNTPWPSESDMKKEPVKMIQ